MRAKQLSCACLIWQLKLDTELHASSLIVYVGELSDEVAGMTHLTFTLKFRWVMPTMQYIEMLEMVFVQVLDVFVVFALHIL